MSGATGFDKLAAESALSGIMAAFHAVDTVRRAMAGELTYPGDLDVLGLLSDVGGGLTREVQVLLFGEDYPADRPATSKGDDHG